MHRSSGNDGYLAILINHLTLFFMKKVISRDLKKFAALLLKWNREKNKRQMPWKGENDPYKIWLSEIILQQTRVEQGLSYYNNFIKTFPGIINWQAATDEKIFKCGKDWVIIQGAGT
jgi:adenine-specific DNA glycosylase